MKGAGLLNAAPLQEYLNSQFIAALEKVAGHPLAVGTTGAFAEDFRCAANQVNTVMKLNEAEPYIWDANDIPIPPVPFVAIGGDNAVPPNARMKLAVWGLNPMFGAGVLEEKTEAVGMNLGNPTHTYAQYAQYHVGITSFPQVLVSAITSNYYRYLWQVVAYLNPHTQVGLLDFLHGKIPWPFGVKNAANFWMTAQNVGVIQLEWFPFHSRRSGTIPAAHRPSWLPAYHDILFSQIVDAVLDPQGVILAVGKDAAEALQQLLAPQKLKWTSYGWDAAANAYVSSPPARTVRCFSKAVWKDRRVAVLHEFWHRANGCLNGNRQMAEFLQHL